MNWSFNLNHSSAAARKPAFADQTLKANFRPSAAMPRQQMACSHSAPAPPELGSLNEMRASIFSFTGFEPSFGTIRSRFESLGSTSMWKVLIIASVKRDPSGAQGSLRKLQLNLYSPSRRRMSARISFENRGENNAFP